MKKSTKAVLLSVFVFPGTGHLLLKRYITGAVIVGTALLAYYILISNVFNKALGIAEKIQSGEIQPDIQVITELVLARTADTPQMNMAVVILFICWLVSVVDSYRLGRRPS